jgi:hypothetical protein
VGIFYTLDTLRNQVILQNGWSISSVCIAGSVPTVDIKSSFPPDWHYCPCAAEKTYIMQKKRSCLVQIGINTGSSNGTPLIIEVIYLRENHTGIIRANQLMLQTFAALGKIDINALGTFTI